jgi:dynein intermediate chain 2
MMQNHGRSTLHGGLCIDYNTAIGGSSKFMVGTEQGAALTCTRRGKSATDRVVAAYKGHHGPVYAVERNIMCPKFFLTVGDWRAHIWMEEIRHPIVSTTYHSAYLTDGAWHPLRPAVFFTTQTDGTLNVWDLLYNQNNPLLSIQVADAGLHCMKVHPNGQMLALGTTKNAVHLRQLGAGLCNPVRDEKSLVGAILERETQRERNIVLRQKELRGKAKRASVLDEETDANYFQPDEAFYYEITTDYITALEEAGIETVTILKNKESLQATKVQSASPAPLRTEGTEY